MRYRLLTREECREAHRPYPTVGFLDEDGELIPDEVFSLKQAIVKPECVSIVLPYTTLEVHELEGVLALLKKEIGL